MYIIKLKGRHHRPDGSVFIELHPVYADFTMNAGAIFQVPFINTVVNDSPLICTGNLQYSVVCRTVNLLFRF